MKSQLEEMKSENLWWKGMSYTVSFACPICSPQPAICRDDTGVHYLDEKEILESGPLACDKQRVGCPDIKRIRRDFYCYWLEGLDDKVRVLLQLVATTGVRSLDLHSNRNLFQSAVRLSDTAVFEVNCFVILCGDLSRARLGSNTPVLSDVSFRLTLQWDIF